MPVIWKLSKSIKIPVLEPWTTKPLLSLVNIPDEEDVKEEIVEEKPKETTDDDVYKKILLKLMNDPNINKWALISSILLPPSVFKAKLK